jgi:hypothetical protein
MVTALFSIPAHAATPTRPYIAPLIGTDAKVPPLPPEYRSDDRSGIGFAYHPSARDRVRVLLDDAESVRRELCVLMGVEVLSSVEVRVAYGSADFDRVLPANAPRGSDVLAFSDAKLIVIGLRTTPTTNGDVRAAFRRAMAMLALDEAAGPHGLPRWFRVGFARYFGRDEALSRTRSLWWASMRQRMLPLIDLDHHMGEHAAVGTVAESEATDFVRFLLDDPRNGFSRLLVGVRQGASFDDALRAAFRDEPAGLERMWREDVAKHKAFLPVLLAGTGVWFLIAVAMRWRRRVRPRPEPPEPKLRARKRKRKKVQVAASAQRAKLREDRVSTQQLPEPDVPKVSHNGRWHTLH